MMLADTTIPTAVIASLGTVAAGLLAFLGAWVTLRAAKKQADRISELRSNADQRKLDQTAFRQFTDRYDLERAEQQRRVQRAEEEAQRTMEALRTVWAHVLQLRSLLREHDIMPPPAPKLPLFPWEDFGSQGGGNGHV